ncbi:MAG: hypothetical protein CMM26_13680 [Rhodospirillaceae bacterium]|nr:hypothetical protein [Rhodospirillaceae bacterium]
MAGHARPAIVAHADWSVDARKRWIARAVRTEGGGYKALAPEPVGDLESFFDRLAAAAGPGETVFAGFDFPLGLPARYAEAAGIRHFAPSLQQFGRGRWSKFYSPAGTSEEINLHRPFYPERPGGTRHKHLIDALGVARIDDLRRTCDQPTDLRFAASPLFWTLGSQQVGKAAISGWRDLIAPARRTRRTLRIWPFDGALPTLLDRPGIVVAETYPGEVYAHLHLRIGAANKSKRNPADRCEDAAPLLTWAAKAGIELSAALAAEIRDGFGPATDGEDRFDATVGLFGMLNVVFGRRPPGDPTDPVTRNIEGWILGLNAAHLRPRAA